MAIAEHNQRPEFDDVIQQLSDYALNYQCNRNEALDTAYYCLLDTLGCGLLALHYPACRKLLGSIIPGCHYLKGVSVPGTSYELDPVQGAFNIGTMVRWLDFNDTWLAAEWGHPSDNLGMIWSLCQYVNLHREKSLTLHDVLQAMIKAHEIQGVLALTNSFNRIGLDHVVLVKIASTAVACSILGLTREQTLNAISLAWVDGHSLRTYRHAPNTGSRKSWAAGDATARAVWLSLIAERGEMGYPSVLTAKTWGVNSVLMRGNDIQLPQTLNSYVMENVLFKIAYPAEFHAQTAVEAAFVLHPNVKGRFNQIDKITLETQEAAVRIINKQGPLNNPADRDHCLQYMVAIGLLHGELTANHYEDSVASDPMIDSLREKMHVIENPEFSKNYLDPNKRSIGNSVQVHFNDGSKTEKITIEYPVGHRRRREEGIPILMEKFTRSVTKWYPQQQAEEILAYTLDQPLLLDMNVLDLAKHLKSL